MKNREGLRDEGRPKLQRERESFSFSVSSSLLLFLMERNALTFQTQVLYHPSHSPSLLTVQHRAFSTFDQLSNGPEASSLKLQLRLF